ncbi:MAG: hypothetical protein KDB27_25340 [Planctomycetales bacterium]|nr:hypothetical protein [Planctomycetales bacterium]
MAAPSSINAQIEYGLDTVANETRMVSVRLKDLLYVHQTLGELVRFFHQPMHYSRIDDVQQFLGNADSGAYSAIRRCYYEALRDCWPEDIVEQFNQRDFESPTLPFYYKSNAEESQ